VEALRASLDDQNVVLIGHSMGAQVALEHVANGAPARALALIDPSRGSDAKPRRRMRLALSFRRTYASREEAIERYRFLPPAEHASETLRRAIATASVEQEDDGRWGYKFDPRWFGLRGGSRPDPRCIGCPTLILRGSESTVLTEAGARSLQAEIDDAQLVVIEDAGHHIQIDRPDALLAALATFLDGLAAV
jgi:pimeloyl-ACP methyl ester carboxylesterase